MILSFFFLKASIFLSDFTDSKILCCIWCIQYSFLNNTIQKLHAILKVLLIKASIFLSFTKNYFICLSPCHWSIWGCCTQFHENRPGCRMLFHVKRSIPPPSVHSPPQSVSPDAEISEGRFDPTCMFAPKQCLFTVPASDNDQAERGDPGCAVWDERD